MSEERLGASFSIDVTDLKAGLATANRLIRDSESEFRAAAAGMDDWTKSEEGLTKRQESLNDQIDIQKKKIAALTAEKQKIIEKMKAEGKSQAEIDRAIDSTNQSITRESKQLDRLKSDLDKTNKALTNLTNETDDAGDSMKDAAEKSKDMGDGFTIAKGAAADLVSNGLQSIVGACKNAITSIAGLASSTRESRSSFAKLEQSFKTAGFTAETAEATMSELYGVLGDSDKATEASMLISKMSKDEADLQRNTRILTGVFAEYGDSIPTESLAEAMASSSAMSSVQGVLADALEWQGVNVDSFNERLAALSTEEERASLIQETLTGLYGESADSFREANKDIIDANEAQLDFNKSLNAFGDKIEPITTKVREGFTKIVNKISELTDGIDFDAVAEKVDKAFDGFINNIMPKIIDALSWIKDNSGLIAAGIGGITAAMLTMNVANMIMGVIKAFKAFKAAQEGATVAQWLLNAAMSANPIGLIVAAVVGLVAAFVILWNKCEGFRNFFINMWNDIKKVSSDVWQALKKGAAEAWDGIKATFSKVGTFFSETFSKAWQKVKDVFSAGGRIFEGIKEGIVSAFKEIVNSLIRGINAVIAVPFKSLNAVLDKIRNVSIAGYKPFEGKIKDISIPEIPQLAQGGVVRKATTALIGEDGEEAIVPLKNNKEWIKAVADELQLHSGQGIVVNQTNNYSQAHSRYEIYKSKQQTAAAVRLALEVQ